VRSFIICAPRRILVRQLDEIRGLVLCVSEERNAKKNFIGMSEGNVFLGYEILGSCCCVWVCAFLGRYAAT